MTGVKALAAAVAIAVAAGAAWWLWLGPGTPPPSNACPAAERAEIAASDVAFEPNIGWQAAELPALATDDDEQVMLAISAFEHGWVAAGRTATGPASHGFLLTSADGATWAAGVDDATALAEAEIRHLVAFDRRAVAAGSISTGEVRSGVWVNQGTPLWRERGGPFERSHPTALAAGADSVLLLGAVDWGGAPLAWSSEDGSTWERVELALPVDPGLTSFSAAAADGDGWLALGALSHGPDRPRWPVVWASPDGAAWTCLLLDRAGFDAVTPTALHRSAQGWLAVGIAGGVCGFAASCPGHAIAWTSPDGVRWGPGITDAAPLSTGGIAIAGSAEGFVAVGHGMAWWSADGNAWVEVTGGGTGAEALLGQPDAIFMTDRGQLAVAGTRQVGADLDAWIAMGALAR